MLLALGAAALQVLTMLLGLVVVAHVVVTQPLAAVPTMGEQEAVGVGPVVIGPGQVVVVQLLPAVGALGVHVCTPTFEVLLLEQVVVVHAFAALAAEGVQVCTATLVVVAVRHVVLVKLSPATAACTLQICTGTSVVTTGAAHVVVVQPFAAVGPEAVHVATGTFDWLLGVHVMPTQPFAADAACLRRYVLYFA